MKRLIYIFIYCMFLVLFISTGAYPQVNKSAKEETAKKTEKRTMKDRPDLSDGKIKPLVSTQLLYPLEGPIDPETYILGPGDILQIGLWGIFEEILVIPVLPSGEILIPTVGLVQVSGITLSKSKDVVTELARNNYPEGEVTVSLSNLRIFKVYVEGAVEFPGMYQANAVMHAAEVLELSGGIEKWGAVREIEIRRKSGKKIVFDLEKFRVTGKFEHNPCLTDGDVVFVPREDLSEGHIFLNVDNDLSGYYKIYPGETVFEIADRIRLDQQLIDWNNAYIMRKTDGGSMSLPVDFRNRSVLQNSDKYILKNRDVLYFIPINFYVYVKGAVRNPGGFEYSPDKTAAYYIGLAGGTEKSGAMKRTKIIRGDTGSQEKGAGVLIRRGDTIVVPQQFLGQSLSDYMSPIMGVATFIISLKAVGIIN